MNKHRRFHRFFSVVTVTLCVLYLTGIAFAQNNNNNTNNSGSSSHRRSLATSGASLTNKQNTQRPTNSNNTAKSADRSNKPSQNAQNKTPQNKQPQNAQNKPTQNKPPQNAQNNRGSQGGAAAQKSPSAAGQGQLRMVDKTMIEVLRTRKVDYNEDVAAASPNVIILNKRVLSPEKSLIERESMLVRESKDNQLAKEAAKIPDDMFEFLGALN